MTKMPAKMSAELKQVFARATALRDAGDLQAAIDLLAPLEEKTSNPAVPLVLGSILEDLDRLDDAIEAFRRAVVLRPKLELASLGLFHALHDMGRLVEARDEATRFMELVKAGSVASCGEDTVALYTRIMRADLDERRRTFAKYAPFRVLPGFKNAGKKRRG